ncbi:DNA/RNA nuclease SfsA [Desulfallas thermosapovorans]|uniref:Sugar fermentation stimulation protein homolog n=1 Tax=Desulfallas thermosapovorans DSM 6562 TaxID=1121431 RepID=A0A5S4ZYC2_9FIRM|nr:DNA/RNA nuclease SfsA [Desulfallas thermosapovorans]TYO98063.1 sugar fermentation stimulation protein A [Desulfallas thermosapovorans DSM 6562]
MLSKIAMPAGMVAGKFIKRLNRFVALVKVNGREALAHVPSSGRMQELLVPGTLVYLAPAAALQRRTEFKLLLVEYGNILVSIDSLLPNRLLYQAFKDELIPGFSGYQTIRREFSYREGRIDFLLSGFEKQCLVEVKSVTLVERGKALFPDAPTARGARHLTELASATSEGYRAAVFFVVQREDGGHFSPHDRRDPEFGEALRLARSRGVEIYALNCRVTPQAVILLGQVPVEL